jgi:hypothetical protein
VQPTELESQRVAELKVACKCGIGIAKTQLTLVATMSSKAPRLDNGFGINQGCAIVAKHLAIAHESYEEFVLFFAIDLPRILVHSQVTL